MGLVVMLLVLGLGKVMLFRGRRLVVFSFGYIG